MTKPKEEPNAGEYPQKKNDHAFDVSQYKDRFEEAVLDAQFMMDYAATNTKSVIDPITLKRLIAARQLTEDGKKLSADQETEFWIAYQDLWELVSPATAESIKANLLIQDTFMSRLVKYFPGLSRWLGRGTTSKARSTVNRYIVFTIMVLFFLLFFQIYWVVGNQLIIDMGALSQREDFLKSQFAEALSNPDSGLAKASLESEITTLESKNERYAAILLFWSKPWNGYIKVVRKEHDPQFEPRFAELERQITEINNKIKDDPDGTKEAKADAQQKDLEKQLADARELVKNGKADQASVDEIQTQIDNLSKINSLATDLVNLQAKYDALQAELEALKTQKVEAENSISILTTNMSTIQNQITDLSSQADYLSQTITDSEIIKANIDAILIARNATSIPSVQAAPTEENSKLPSLAEGEIAALPVEMQAEIEIIKNLNDQLNYLSDKQSNISVQLDLLHGTQQELNNQWNALTNESNDIQDQISTLSENVDLLSVDIIAKGDTLTETQTEIDNKKTRKAELEEAIVEFQGEIDQVEAQKIAGRRQAELQRLDLLKQALSFEEQEYFDRTDSRPAQLAGQFVLNILQSYFLPILYGLLGASTSVLRTLSRQIKEVTFSEKTGIQHLLSISLGALAGIVVGWFSFLIDGGNSFLGSVSPLAIAFLVGFNIDPFFSRMDLIMKNESETARAAAPATKIESRLSKPQTESKPLPAPSALETEVTKDAPKEDPGGNG